MNWQIEQGCPQCGAPTTLDETDRLLSCPFCRTRLYLSARGPFRYLIPAAEAAGELLHVPYWRLRGASFAATSAGVVHRFLDHSVLAAALPGLPHSLGFRPQVLKLRFATPAAKGRFLRADRTASDVLPAMAPPPRGSFIRGFIGEAVSLIYAPLLLRGETLFDAVLDRPACSCGAERLEPLQDARSERPEPIRFIPTLCPHCGWDLEGEKDSLVLLCRNCHSAWSCSGESFERVDFAVMRPPPEADPAAVHLPFWRMKARIEGIELKSYADLIRIANLPKAVTAALAEEPLFFRSPAFKIQPALYLRWARQMTVFRPSGETGEALPKTPLHPVTLPLSDASDGILLNLAQMVADRRRLLPELAGLRVSLEESCLEYHPFLASRSEFLHPSLGTAIDRTALAYGTAL